MKSALVQIFIKVKDPRIDRRKKYSLLEILIVTIASVMCGAETWNDVEDYGNSLLERLRQMGLELSNGIPSHDTFRRVFSLINPIEFQKIFFEWASFARSSIDKGVIAIDGKTLCGAFGEGEKKSSIHMVNAWATEAGICLGQLRSSGKSNEIETIPILIDLLKLKKENIVTIDAMGCQKKIVEKIREKGADYLIAVKGNQETLHQQVQNIFKISEEKNFKVYRISKHHTEEQKRGRKETRHYYTLQTLPARLIGHLNLGNEWTDLNSITMVKTVRQLKNKKEVKSTRFYMSSLKAKAKDIAPKIRSHWQIENQLNWSMDVAFREDESRMRKENSPDNFGMVRRLVFNLLRTEPSKKSIRRKRKICGWDPNFLNKALIGQHLAAF